MPCSSAMSSEWPRRSFLNLDNRDGAQFPDDELVSVLRVVPGISGHVGGAEPRVQPARLFEHGPELRDVRPQLRAADFFTVQTLTFKTLYASSSSSRTRAAASCIST